MKEPGEHSKVEVRAHYVDTGSLNLSKKYKFSHYKVHRRLNEKLRTGDDR